MQWIANGPGELEARIVAEVPVIWKRKDTLSRGIFEDYRESMRFGTRPRKSERGSWMGFAVPALRA